MAVEHSDPWWAFSIGREPVEALERLTAGAGPDLPPSEYSYRKYIALDRLLTAQRTCSSIPDERAFLITHQLIELTFKLMIFDVAVIVRTLDTVDAMPPTDRVRVCVEDDAYWRAAATASARLLFSARTLLPSILRCLSPGPTPSEAHFDRAGFFVFREKLGNSSGLQSAQFRLLQRAFGKSPLLALPLFPRPGTAMPAACVAVTDASILQADAPMASPDGDSPLAPVATLDARAHQVLASCAQLDESAAPAPVAPIEQPAVRRALQGLAGLRAAAHAGSTAADCTHEWELLAGHLERAVASENQRRAGLSSAGIGARWLKEHAPRATATQVFQRIADADDALHGRHPSSFLSTHLVIAGQMLASPEEASGARGDGAYVTGSAGGSIAYLGCVRNLLLPLFPALVAFRSAARDA